MSPFSSRKPQFFSTLQAHTCLAPRPCGSRHTPDGRTCLVGRKHCRRATAAGCLACRLGAATCCPKKQHLRRVPCRGFWNSRRSSSWRVVKFRRDSALSSQLCEPKVPVARHCCPAGGVAWPTGQPSLIQWPAHTSPCHRNGLHVGKGLMRRPSDRHALAPRCCDRWLCAPGKLCRRAEARRLHQQQGRACAAAAASAPPVSIRSYAGRVVGQQAGVRRRLDLPGLGRRGRAHDVLDLQRVVAWDDADECLSAGHSCRRPQAACQHAGGRTACAPASLCAARRTSCGTAAVGRRGACSSLGKAWDALVEAGVVPPHKDVRPQGGVPDRRRVEHPCAPGLPSACWRAPRQRSTETGGHLMGSCTAPGERGCGGGPGCWSGPSCRRPPPAGLPAGRGLRPGPVGRPWPAS